MPNAREFRLFTLGQFEYQLKNILYQNRAGFMSDITREWQEEGNATWEHIYKITTRNPSVDIIVFSSVDMRTNKVRENGDDRVRLVFRWRTKNGYRWRKIGRHNRIATLFDNVKNSILNAQGLVFKLGELDWSQKLDA